MHGQSSRTLSGTLSCPRRTRVGFLPPNVPSWSYPIPDARLLRWSAARHRSGCCFCSPPPPPLVTLLTLEKKKQDEQRAVVVPVGAVVETKSSCRIKVKLEADNA